MEQILGYRVSSPGVYLQQMPYPCYRRDKFNITLFFFLPLTMLLAWMLSVAMSTRTVVREKESKQTEIMKIMGVSGGLLRLSWFLYSIVISLLSILGMVILLKNFGLLPKTNWFLLFLFLTIYSLATLNYSFLVGSFFNNANLAACASASIYFPVVLVIFVMIPNLNSIGPLILGACVSCYIAS